MKKFKMRCHSILGNGKHCLPDEKKKSIKVKVNLVDKIHRYTTFILFILQTTSVYCFQQG